MSPELIPLDTATLESLVEGRHGEAEYRLGVRIPAGWPDDNDVAFLRLRLGQLRGDPARDEWPVHALVVGRELVGHAGYHGPPGANALGAADAVEVGYTVFEPHRGRGHATAAVRELVARARERGAARVLASIAPDNAPSLAVVSKLGFRHVDEVGDEEDGRELVFELRI